MKKLLMVSTLCLALAGCGGNTVIRTGKGGVYESYGFANDSTYHSKHVCYRISPASVILAFIFSETIVVPLYFIGFDLFDPIRLKQKMIMIHVAALTFSYEQF
jgi:hypothetical protein